VDTITANLAIVTMSETVSFTISTTGFPSPTTVYWRDSGTSESGDFVDGKKFGSVVLTGNTGVVTRTISNTPTAGHDIKLDIRRTPGTKGKILKTSSTVSIA
jgi:hypothetical protein